VRARANAAKKLRCRDLIAVLESPKNFGNIGGVIRNIDALGVSKLYVVDPFKILPPTWEEMRERKHLNDISSSAVKWTFVKTFQTTQDCLSHLQKKGFVSFATSPHHKGKTNIPLREGMYTQKKLAVWFGNESHGLSEEALNGCQACLQIPMAGIIESLNLATCTGIVLYEITSQRRNFLKARADTKQQKKSKTSETL
jgi:tRNA (guanosine-2'-O-)-methyltransferase